MDPVLVIADGLAGPAAALSWDAASRLLAAAVGGEARVWDVAAAKEGGAEGAVVCGGFGEGARVSCLAFQPDGALLVGWPRGAGLGFCAR
jgi:hypothetical protein